MSEVGSSPADPRWGQCDRDRKAEAILATLRMLCDRSFAGDIWLDVGCGSGGVAATLAAHVRQVVGVDPEPWDRWQQFGRLHTNLAFHVASCRDLENLLGRESVDVVVCNQVYEHVDDPVALLEAIRAVMKPGAVCYFAGPNLLWPIEPHVFWPFVHWLPRRFAIGLMRMCRSRYAESLDARSWSYWKLIRAFCGAGLAHTSVIHDRLRASALIDGSLGVRMLGRLPNGLFATLVPFAPGFVFLLRRQEDTHL